MKAPKYYDGKELRFEEIFRPPVARPTEQSAREVLNLIRECHSSSSGWIEIESHIERTPNGFVAVRHHAQYK